MTGTKLKAEDEAKMKMNDQPVCKERCHLSLATQAKGTTARKRMSVGEANLCIILATSR
jgi:hypothetical protein